MKNSQSKQEKRPSDDFELNQPRLGMKRMRDLLTNLRDTNSSKPCPSESVDPFADDLRAATAHLLTDVTPILRMRPVSQRTRLLLFYSHFLPYLFLAFFPLLLAFRLLCAM